MSRLFVAVWPPDEVLEELRALPRKDERGVRFVHPDSWHITLRFLGDADPDQAEAYWLKVLRFTDVHQHARASALHHGDGDQQTLIVSFGIGIVADLIFQALGQHLHRNRPRLGMPNGRCRGILRLDRPEKQGRPHQKRLTLTAADERLGHRRAACHSDASKSKQ